VALLIGEVWFLAALGRMAAALRSPTAAGRVNRFLILVGLLAGLAAVLPAAYQLFGQEWADANVFAKWAALDAKLKQYATFGGVAVAALLGTLIYWRMYSGVKQAIRENYES
jgi:hypothetical protein